MKTLTIIVALALAAAAQLATADEPVLPTRPVIVKKGTITCDLTEAHYFVWKGRLLRAEWARGPYRNLKKNPDYTGDKESHIQIRDAKTNEKVAAMAVGHEFGTVFVEGDIIYIVATKIGRYQVNVFASKDLQHWDQWNAIEDRQFTICNTSVIKVGHEYTMMFEIGRPNVVSWTARFAKSKDMKKWEILPEEYIHGRSYMAAPHYLGYHDGWFYNFHGRQSYGFSVFVSRSRDLTTWEDSLFNPVLRASDDDRRLAPRVDFTEVQKERIATARNRNNSDVDIFEYQGKVLISYSWGDQVGNEFLAEAEYAGTRAQFLEGWFPDLSAWAGIDIRQPPSTFLKNRADYGGVLSARGATVTVSSGSTNNLAQLVSGTCLRPYAFQTGGEINPHVTIDLGHEADLTGILIRNRTDCCQERAENLCVRVSHDNQSWEEIWKADAIEPVWEIPLLGKKVKARYLCLETHPKTPTPFHLQHVEVWGN